MKNSKVLNFVNASKGWMVVAALIACMVSLSSFASEKYYDDAFTTVCYKYVGPPNFDGADIAEASNWTPFDGNPAIDCDNTNLLCIICFNDEAEYSTLEEAIDDLSSTGPNGGGLQEVADLGSIDGATFPNTSVTLYQFDGN